VQHGFWLKAGAIRVGRCENDGTAEILDGPVSLQQGLLDDPRIGDDGFQGAVANQLRILGLNRFSNGLA
jgi:hypothetical protein